VAAGHLRTNFSGGQRVGVFNQVWTHKPEWFFPLAPVAALGILSFATLGWFARKPDSKSECAIHYCKWRWLIAGSRSHVAVLVLAIRPGPPARRRVHGRAMGVFALAVWRRNREALLAAAVYALVALLALWAVEGLKWMSIG